MAIISQRNSLKIGSNPVVVLPLKKWREIEEKIEEMEEALRFQTAYVETRKEKGLTLKELSKKYNLK